VCVCVCMLHPCDGRELTRRPAALYTTQITSGNLTSLTALDYGPMETEVVTPAQQRANVIPPPPPPPPPAAEADDQLPLIVGCAAGGAALLLCGGGLALWRRRRAAHQQQGPPDMRVHPEPARGQLHF
jgi:hypothetical protein